MTVPTHIKFTVRGVFTNTPEEWSFGMKFDRSVPGGPDVGLDDVDEGAVTTAVGQFFSGGSIYLPDNAKVIDWRMYQIAATGNMEEGTNPLLHIMSSAVQGTVAAKYPPQIAAVVTTVGANRGPGRFGRFYLPTAATLDTDRRISANDATNIANSCSTFMKNVSGAINVPLSLANVPGINVSTRNGGAKQEIDHIEVGRVLDTLRNRRKSLVEDRRSTGHIDW